jgi:hypothetical protein
LSNIRRKLIRSETYQGRTIEARWMGPDLLSFVDTLELSGFFIDAQAAIEGAQRYIDAEITAAAQKAAKSVRESPR